MIAAMPAESRTDPDTARWAAVLARDARADGTFYYSVETTGVYCRPSCPSRRANRGNVRFHATRDAAERAGFRPCRRCHPEREDGRSPQADRIAAACRAIDAADEMPALADLAAAAGLSAYHFHRTFKAVTGLTPREYAAAARRGRVRGALADTGRSVTAAIYDAGFNSSGRFYEGADRLLGMSPTAFRQGGRGSTIKFAVGESSLGAVLVACSEVGVCAILLGDDPEALVRDLEDRFPRASLVGGDASFERTVARVVALVEQPAKGLELPLDVRGTAFQRRVWKALADVPPGQTASYVEIARTLGHPRASRAVARACAANPLAVAIPCHRIVRSDGTASGYRWGIDRKRALLDRESR